MEKVWRLVKSHSITLELCKHEPMISNGINIRPPRLFCKVKEVAWESLRRYWNDAKIDFWMTSLLE